MTQPEIRLAQEADRQFIVRCVNLAYAPYIARIGKRPAPMQADYAALIAAGSVYVVPGERGIDAVLVLEVRDDHLFVENVAVRPSRQGTGLGKRLMQFAENQARAHGLPEIRLYTHEMMTENQVFYPRLGYQETERRTEDGFNRIYFRKVLAEPA